MLLVKSYSEISMEMLWIFIVRVSLITLSLVIHLHYSNSLANGIVLRKMEMHCRKDIKDLKL